MTYEPAFMIDQYSFEPVLFRMKKQPDPAKKILVLFYVVVLGVDRLKYVILLISFHQFVEVMKFERVMFYEDWRHLLGG